jgi:type III pantothenate kinase
MYKTPNTLGADRLAGAVGATVLFPDENNLVIDMGTCITLDFVNKDGEYKGGAILPGISMKFKALHTFTNKLPLLSTENLVDTANIIGNDTQSSIILGVINATCYELEGFVDRYIDTFGPINIIFTGGDAIYFEKRVKFPNFVNSNLLLIGLNKILNYNE